MEREQKPGNSILTIIKSSGEYELKPTAGEGNEVTALLAFLGQLNTRWAVIDYIYLDEKQRLTTLDLRSDPELNDLDYETFLIGKADELICSSDVRIKLVNPDTLDEYGDFNI